MICKTDIDEIRQYLTDEANYTGDCIGVYIVENAAEITALIKRANTENFSVTVCGNHTSVTGASIPNSGWVIATERLNKILNFNKQNKTVSIEPGVTLNDLQAFLKTKGYFLPPDPTEDSCFVGGMLGTNASGARSYKYGAIRKFVQEIDIVLPTGQEVKITRDDKILENFFCLKLNAQEHIEFEMPDGFYMPQVKNAAGYYLERNGDVIDLFIGAEGTLGIITSITLKVCEIPSQILSLVIFINDLDHGFSFLEKLKAKTSYDQINPTLIEFFDKNSLKLLSAKFSGIPSNTSVAFWIEQEIDVKTDYYDVLSIWENFLNENGIGIENVWLGIDETDRKKISDFRHALPIEVNERIKQRNQKKLGTDVSVPDSVFESYYKEIVGKVESHNIDYVAFGHFGDSHIHLNMLPQDYAEQETGKELYNLICNKAVELNGTFSAEHGVGKRKKPFLEKMYGKENFEFMKKIKKRFDPNSILSPGNLF